MLSLAVAASLGFAGAPVFAAAAPDVAPAATSPSGALRPVGVIVATAQTLWYDAGSGQYVFRKLGRDGERGADCGVRSVARRPRSRRCATGLEPDDRADVSAGGLGDDERGSRCCRGSGYGGAARCCYARRCSRARRAPCRSSGPRRARCGSSGSRTRRRSSGSGARRSSGSRSSGSRTRRRSSGSGARRSSGSRSSGSRARRCGAHSAGTHRATAVE